MVLIDVKSVSSWDELPIKREDVVIGKDGMIVSPALLRGRSADDVLFSPKNLAMYINLGRGREALREENAKDTRKGRKRPPVNGG